MTSSSTDQSELQMCWKWQILLNWCCRSIRPFNSGLINCRLKESSVVEAEKTQRRLKEKKQKVCSRIFTKEKWCEGKQEVMAGTSIAVEMNINGEFESWKCVWFPCYLSPENSETLAGTDSVLFGRTSCLSGRNKRGYSFVFWPAESRRPEGNVALSFCFSSRLNRKNLDAGKKTCLLTVEQSGPPLFTNSEVHLLSVNG